MGFLSISCLGSELDAGMFRLKRQSMSFCKRSGKVFDRKFLVWQARGKGMGTYFLSSSSPEH